MDYQIDVQTTVNTSLKETWNFLFSNEGLEIWLGTSKLDKWETGIKYTTRDGIIGKVRVFSPYSHIRLSWRKGNWQNDSILHVRTISKDNKTIIRIHHEHFADKNLKEDMEIHWKDVLDRLSAILDAL